MQPFYDYYCGTLLKVNNIKAYYYGPASQQSVFNTCYDNLVTFSEQPAESQSTVFTVALT